MAGERKADNQQNILRSSISISAVVLLGKVLGFGKQAVIAWAFGSNAVTDIYFAADGYTSTFGQIMGTSVAPTILTRYVKVREQQGPEEGKQLIRVCFLFFGSVGLLLTLFNILFSGSITNLIGISYDAEQKEQLVYYLVALCPVMLFTSLSGVAQGYLDANKRFLPAKVCSLFFSVSIIICILLFRNTIGLRSLLLGFMLGYGFHTLFMLLLVLPQTGIAFKNPFRDDEFRGMLTKFFPVIIGNSIVDISHLIDKIVASSLAAGSVSALYYGQVISGDLVHAVIITAIGTVFLTSLTNAVSSRHNNTQIVSDIRVVLSTVICITAGISALYFVEGYDLVKLFFERGGFTSDNTVIVSSIAVFYALGFVFMAAREVLIKAHYAYQDTMTPMINSTIGMAVNLVGSIALSKIMGVSGIALATTISLCIVSALSLRTIKRHTLCPLINTEIIKDVGKMALSVLVTAAMGLGLKAVFAGNNLFIRMAIVSIAMIACYIILLLLLKEAIIIDIINKYKRLD